MSGSIFGAEASGTASCGPEASGSGSILVGGGGKGCFDSGKGSNGGKGNICGDTGGGAGSPRYSDSSDDMGGKGHKGGKNRSFLCIPYTLQEEVEHSEFLSQRLFKEEKARRAAEENAEELVREVDRLRETVRNLEDELTEALGCVATSDMRCTELSNMLDAKDKALA